jgi:hypothetical protein
MGRSKLSNVSPFYKPPGLARSKNIPLLFKEGQRDAGPNFAPRRNG